MTIRHRRLLLLMFAVFAASCIVGPALDQIHVSTGALWYADPWLLDQAWWVGPQFGLAFAGLAAAALLIQLRFGTSAPVHTPTTRVAQQLAWFLAAYLTTGLLWERPWVVVVLLAVGIAVRFAAVRPDAATLRTMALLAAAGWTYEAVLSSIPGTFSYAATGGPPAPIWLPLLYAHGAPLLRTFARTTAPLVRRPS